MMAPVRASRTRSPWRRHVVAGPLLDGPDAASLALLHNCARLVAEAAVHLAVGAANRLRLLLQAQCPRSSASAANAFAASGSFFRWQTPDSCLAARRWPSPAPRSRAASTRSPVAHARCVAHHGALGVAQLLAPPRSCRRRCARWSRRAVSRRRPSGGVAGVARCLARMLKLCAHATAIIIPSPPAEAPPSRDNEALHLPFAFSLMPVAGSSGAERPRFTPTNPTRSNAAVADSAARGVRRVLALLKPFERGAPEGERRAPCRAAGRRLAGGRTRHTEMFSALRSIRLNRPPSRRRCRLGALGERNTALFIGDVYLAWPERPCGADTRGCQARGA